MKHSLEKINEIANSGSVKCLLKMRDIKSEIKSVKQWDIF